MTHGQYSNSLLIYMHSMLNVTSTSTKLYYTMLQIINCVDKGSR